MSSRYKDISLPLEQLTLEYRLIRIEQTHIPLAVQRIQCWFLVMPCKWRIQYSTASDLPCVLKIRMNALFGAITSAMTNRPEIPVPLHCTHPSPLSQTRSGSHKSSMRGARPSANGYPYPRYGLRHCKQSLRTSD